MGKRRLVFARILAVLVAFVLVQQGWFKLFEEGRWTPSFDEWGYPPWFRVLIGVLEIGGSLALLVPWIAPVGGIVVAVVMAGACGTLLLGGRYGDFLSPLTYGVIALWIAFEQREWVLQRQSGGEGPTEGSRAGG